MNMHASSQPRCNRAQSGFTLIELLVVLGIMTGFLAMLVQFVDSGVRLFDEGEAGQMLADRAEAARSAVERELRAITADARKLDQGVPDDRFVVQRLGLGLPSRVSANDPKTFVLRAGVALSPSAEEALLQEQVFRRAVVELGDKADAETVQARAKEMQASSGLRGRGRILLAQWPQTSDGALLELRIGKFLIDHTIELGEDRAVDPFAIALLGGAELPSLAVHANTELLVGNLLFADVELWSQSTESWTASGNTGPEVVWDSARAGWLADPAFGPVWRFDRDETSLDQPADDVHPRAMRVTLVVAAEESRPKDGILQQPIEADTTVIELVNGERFPGATDGGWCKVEGEWVRYAERVGDELRGCRRGQRGTRPMPHPASSVVRVGRTVQFTIAFPHAKDDWNG